MPHLPPVHRLDDGWYNLPPAVPGPPPSLVHFMPFPGHPQVPAPVLLPITPTANSDTTARTSSPPSTVPPPPRVRYTPIENVISLARVRDGQDLRTTVMIRNISNKLSCPSLVSFIHRVVGKRIDFVYLPIDFSNGYNFGYAFVNFMTTQDLVVFTRTKLGRKWGLFKSEKALEMCYTDIQGKTTLVEHFRNKPVMNERKSDWKPRVFPRNLALDKVCLSRSLDQCSILRERNGALRSRGRLSRGVVFESRP
ncbi:hypothetical protein L218DRAFT_959264 [Marasmius fiardii PR-910]|nr:hypothetical protein L218DRAFT_959264 [Marasmius fiardii PR-910]